MDGADRATIAFAHADALARNLAAVRSRIDAACARAGRAPDAARLVAVTKGLGPAATAALAALGQRDLAENRVQALEEKIAAVAAADGPAARPPPAPRWHLIGHLQRNKAKRFLATGALLHALDSVALLDDLAARVGARASGEPGATPPRDVLVEVNVTGEAQKHGIAPDALDDLLDRAAASGRIAVTGLMAMAREGAPEAEARATFAALRALRDRARQRHPGVRELSMGMSQDFEWACEEGATLVRVGSALAAGLPPEALAGAGAGPRASAGAA